MIIGALPGTVALVLLGAAVVAAVLDWIVCGLGARRPHRVLRSITKGLPPTLLVVGLGYHALEQPKPSWTMVIATAALCLCLLGDELLLDPTRFRSGTLAFCGAQLVLALALLQDARPGGWPAWVALGVVLVGMALVAPGVLRGSTARGEASSTGLYLLLVSLMVVAAGIHALAPGGWFAFAGALAFYLSDALLGRRRYVRGRDGDSVLVMISYHAALFLFGAWLLCA